jgi:hypothetical protein
MPKEFFDDFVAVAVDEARYVFPPNPGRLLCSHTRLTLCFTHRKALQAFSETIRNFRIALRRFKRARRVVDLRGGNL